MASSRQDPPSIDRIAPLLVGVQTNPERDASLESLAREWGYSPSHFHRPFTETVGETPKAHVEVATDGSVTAQVKSPPLVPRADYPAASIDFSTGVTAPLPGQIRRDPSEKRIEMDGDFVKIP